MFYTTRALRSFTNDSYLLGICRNKHMLTIRSTKWVLGTEHHSSPALLKLEIKSERAPLGWGRETDDRRGTAALLLLTGQSQNQTIHLYWKRNLKSPIKWKTKITKLRLILCKGHRGKENAQLVTNALALRAWRPESVPMQRSQACNGCVKPSTAADMGGFPRLADWSASLA